MTFPPAHTYRASLAVAFAVCLGWAALVLFGGLNTLPLPGELKAILAVFVPLFGSTAILYRTVLFREMDAVRRLAYLFGVAVALLVCVGALLLAFSLVLFGLGIIGPD